VRVRLRFSKLGKIRFTSHRDVARLWERSLRKADLEVVYTEGFSPRPKMHFGLALSTAHESEAEYVDIDLVDADGGLAAVAVADGSALFEHLAHRLNPVLTEGMTITGAAVADTRAPSLQEDVVACRWSITLDGVDAERAREAVATAMAADSLVVSRIRKGERRSDDVRPAIETLDVVTEAGAAVIEAVLATKPRGLRPGELLAAVFGGDAGSPDGDGPAGAELLARRVVRRQQFIERDGSRSELPPLALAPAPHAPVVCA
jgi:radical SAM-linked protein